MESPDWQRRFEEDLIPLVCSCSDRPRMVACMQAVVEGLFCREDDAVNKRTFLKMFENHLEHADDASLRSYAEEFLRMVMSIRIELAMRARLTPPPKRPAGSPSTDIELLQQRLHRAPDSRPESARPRPVAAPPARTHA